MPPSPLLFLYLLTLQKIGSVPTPPCNFSVCWCVAYRADAASRFTRSMNPAAAAYENAHVTSLEAQLSQAVDSCMRLRPADPAAYIGVRLISASAIAKSPSTPHPGIEAVASEPSAGAVASEWTAISWLDSEETNRELAAAMLGQSFVTGGDSYRTPLSSHLTARRREAEGASTLRVGSKAHLIR